MLIYITYVTMNYKLKFKKTKNLKICTKIIMIFFLYNAEHPNFHSKLMEKWV